MYIAKAKALTKNWRGTEVVGEEFGGSKTCFSESTIYTFIKFSCIVNISPDQCSVLSWKGFLKIFYCLQTFQEYFLNYL